MSPVITAVWPSDSIATQTCPGVWPVDGIRWTSGEMRLSNFLLWQLAYAEIYVTPTLWPDFRGLQLLEGIAEYQKRERRYGGLNHADKHAAKAITAEFTEDAEETIPS